MLIGLISCPKCGSSDANAEYSDSFYCFSCSTYKSKGMSLSRFKPLKEVKLCNGITLQKELPSNAVKWLLGYGLTLSEMAQFHYSNKRIGKYGEMACDLLVLYSDVNYYVARNFGRGVKYISSGIKPVIKYGNNSDTCIIVEDIISAIKVGRQFTAIPMMGSMPPKDTERHLQEFQNIILWQDRDLAVKSLKTARNLSERLGKIVRVVISENDPKEYSDLQISKYINI